MCCPDAESDALVPTTREVDSWGLGGAGHGVPGSTGRRVGFLAVGDGLKIRFIKLWFAWQPVCALDRRIGMMLYEWNVFNSNPRRGQKAQSFPPGRDDPSAIMHCLARLGRLVQILHTGHL